MKYKHLYAAHEARMWIGTIISGIAAVGAITATHPEWTEKVKAKVNSVKGKFKKKKPIEIVVVNKEEP